MENMKRIAAILATVLLVAIAIALTVQFSGNRRPYLIEVDGEAFTHSGGAGLVSEVLDEAGISTGPADRIVPPLEARIESGSIISVTRANKVIMIIDGLESIHWTHQNKLNQFLAEIGTSWGPTTRIYADGQQVLLDSIVNQDLPHEVKLNNQLNIDVVESAERLILTTLEDTVGSVLWENGIDIFSSDDISPPIGSWLVPNQEIIIRRANSYWVDVDGEKFQVYSYYTKTHDILFAADVSLAGSDYSVPSLNAEVSSGDTIKIFRVHQEYRINDEPIPYSSSLVPSQDLELDQRLQLSTGIPGTRRKVSRITIENDVPKAESLVGEWLLRPPVDQSIGYGTKIVIRIMDTPDGPIEYWRVVSMRATAYTAATAGKPPSHPAYGITASGVPAGAGVVAIDPAVVPFRSNLYVPGYGLAFAGDTGGAVKGRIIDLGYDEGELVSWSGYVDVYFLTPIPPVDQINYLLP